MAATIQTGRKRSRMESLPMTDASPVRCGGDWVWMLTVLLCCSARLMNVDMCSITTYIDQCQSMCIMGL